MRWVGSFTLPFPLWGIPADCWLTSLKPSAKWNLSSFVFWAWGALFWQWESYGVRDPHCLSPTLHQPLWLTVESARMLWSSIFRLLAHVLSGHFLCTHPLLHNGFSPSTPQWNTSTQKGREPFNSLLDIPFPFSTSESKHLSEYICFLSQPQLTLQLTAVHLAPVISLKLLPRFSNPKHSLNFYFIWCCGRICNSKWWMSFFSKLFSVLFPQLVC